MKPKKTRTNRRGQIEIIKPTRCKAITQDGYRCTYGARIKGLCLTHYITKLRGTKIKTTK